MRKGCKRRRSSEIGIDNRVNDLGAMAWAVAPELFLWKGNGDTIARSCDDSLENYASCGILYKEEFLKTGKARMYIEREYKRNL